MYKSVFQDKRRNLKTVKQAIARLVKNKTYNNRLKQLRYFDGFINKDSKCLEIGGGWGTLAKIIKDKFACHVKVIEPSKLAAKVAQEYYNLDIYNGDFANFIKQRADNHKYNFIFSYHVFEHILEPDLFLENIKKLLDKNGVLLMALPNVLNPDQPTDKFFHIEHCYYYTPKTLELTLNKHGFKIIKLWKCKTDMKAACVVDKDIKLENFSNNEARKIAEKIKAVNRKYKILRFTKKVIYAPLSGVQREKINKIIFNFRK